MKSKSRRFFEELPSEDQLEQLGLLKSLTPRSPLLYQRKFDSSRTTRTHKTETITQKYCEILENDTARDFDVLFRNVLAGVMREKSFWKREHLAKALETNATQLSFIMRLTRPITDVRIIDDMLRRVGYRVTIERMPAPVEKKRKGEKRP